MQRTPSTPRPDLDAQLAKLDFRYASIDGEPYWDETVRYVFSMQEIEERLEKATADLYALCLDLVDRVVASYGAMRRLRIPRHAWDLIAASWHRRDPSLYGRFDFVYDGEGPPKLLEFNADTPTSLYESAVVQWFWLEQMITRGELPPDADQFNSLHEKLIARWKEIAGGGLIHLACMKREADDLGTTAYIEECARQAGLRTSLIDIRDVGLLGKTFVDRSENRIEMLFKLYPWEWVFADEFGHSRAMAATRFIEPPWKAILSNKGMLAQLWDMAPNHPNLLECYFEDDPNAARLVDRYARKPLYSREGANVELVDGGRTVSGPRDGYGAEGFVRQALSPLPQFDGRYPVIGSWLVGDEPAGMSVREDNSPVTTSRARFVPHAIVG